MTVFPTCTVKPWGYELVLGLWNGWRVKILHVNDGHRTSKQYHMYKDEYWFYKDGKVRHVEPFEVHRLIGPIEVVELARGSDDDIIRLEDDYGRRKD